MLRRSSSLKIWNATNWTPKKWAKLSWFAFSRSTFSTIKKGWAASVPSRRTRYNGWNLAPVYSLLFLGSERRGSGSEIASSGKRLFGTTVGFASPAQNSLSFGQQDWSWWEDDRLRLQRTCCSSSCVASKLRICCYCHFCPMLLSCPEPNKNTHCFGVSLLQNLPMAQMVKSRLGSCHK